MRQDLAFAVEARNLCVSFGDFYAVKDVTFSVPRGEIFGFLGANGAGKTTTIRVLCGLLPPSSGHVAVDGATYAEGERAIKTKVGYMSQKFTLYDDLTVAENLSFAASLRGIDGQTLRERRTRLLSFVGFDQNLNTLVKQLPGGLKQQVSLAASLLHEPAIIFLDEPTAGVSPGARKRFWALIRSLQNEGKTIFVTTHYMDEAEYCGRIALMRSGELIALDTVAGLKRKAFPEPLFELEPKGSPLNPQELAIFGQDPCLKSFQAYGIRYHAAVKTRAAFEAARPRFSERFTIQETAPSLEDVFIEMVEGGTR